MHWDYPLRPLAQRWPAGKAQAKDRRNLVECLACGIIASAAKKFHRQCILAVEYRCVPAADDHADAGKNIALRCKPARVNVRRNMVDCDERHPQRQCQHLGRCDTHQQANLRGRAY